MGPGVNFSPLVICLSFYMAVRVSDCCFFKWVFCFFFLNLIWVLFVSPKNGSWILFFYFLFFSVSDVLELLIVVRVSDCRFLVWVFLSIPIHSALGSFFC